jgi:hypothetical protein
VVGLGRRRKVVTSSEVTFFPTLFPTLRLPLTPGATSLVLGVSNGN